jgi:predicted Zn finger-like uncharacterized protein
MRFVCESCRAQYMINDDKVGPKGVKVRCRKCGYVITVKRTDATGQAALAPAPGAEAEEAVAAALAADGEAIIQGTVVAPAEKKESFLGADEDEIGAVFDQALSSGGSPRPGASAPTQKSAASADEGDQDSTRVLDQRVVEQLARESGAEPVPETNWFVAIDEKQTGPLTLEKVKEHWDRGEVGPDSLCWREGFGDWIPLASVASLGAVLAPKPPRPILVPSATVPSVPAVVSVPVQSAFSAGGVVQTVQSEVQVPFPAPANEEGAWRPGAASALASLVKDELDALARPSRPATPPPAQAEPPRPAPTLLDLPEDRPAAPSRPSAPRTPERAAANPYLAPPPGPPPAAYPPPPSNRGLVIGLSVAGGAVVLAMLGMIGWLATRPAAVAVAPPPAVAVAPPVAPPPAPAVPVAQAPAAQPAPPTPVVAPPVTPTPAPTPAPPVATTPVREPTRAIAAPPTPPRPPARVARPEPAAPEAPRAAEGGDEFDRAFGGSAKAAKREEPKPEPVRKKDVYVPPAPGGGADVKDSLGKSDIMEVVLANKAAFARCVEEQRQKEPGTSGALVLRWQILTTGKVSNVTVVSEEFKSTYMAGCVTRQVKGLSFPRHKQQGEPITFPFRF